MFSQMDNEITSMLEELRAQQKGMSEAFAKMREVTATARSKDRMFEATVDSHGRLTGITINGQRWRDMAPKEIAAKIVEVVNQAQDEAAGDVAALVSTVAPEGVDFAKLRESGPDFEDMLAKAAEDLRKWER